MNHLPLYLLSALVMFLLEFFILLRVYQRSPTLQKISLAVAPLMIVFALWLTFIIQKYFSIPPNSSPNPLVLFIVLMLLELPLSLYGYEIQPNATIPERMIVAGSVGVASVLIAQGILSYFQ
jgi:hypothetical protein